MAYELPRLTKCCCLQLRTGALIIGYFVILGTLFGIFGTIGDLVVLVRYTNKPNLVHTQDELRNRAIKLYVLHAFNLLVYLMYLIVSILLVIGAHKYLPKYMKYFFYGGSVILVINVIVVIVNFVFTNIFVTMGLLFSCLITFYFLLVVRSSYLEMEDQLTIPQPGPNIQPRETEMTNINKPLMA